MSPLACSMIQWGNVAEWIAALAALFGFVGAFVLLKRQLKTYEAEHEDRIRRLAEGVSVWSRRTPGPDGSTIEVAVFAKNAGQGPVYRAAIRVMHQGAPVIGDFGTLAPGETRHTTLGVPSVLQLITDTTDPPVEIYFTDGAGRHWLRDFSGDLEQRPSPYVVSGGITIAKPKKDD